VVAAPRVVARVRTLREVAERSTHGLGESVHVVVSWIESMRHGVDALLSFSARTLMVVPFVLPIVDAGAGRDQAPMGRLRLTQVCGS
jgi:hypothetical protein